MAWLIFLIIVVTITAFALYRRVRSYAMAFAATCAISLVIFYTIGSAYEISRAGRINWPLTIISLTVSLPIAAAIAGLIGFTYYLRRVNNEDRAKHRFLCTHCGYDLSGHADLGPPVVCPECGNLNSSG
jgi:uncharacterized membrane protein YdjX (TVP38/TMEM64 family)